MSKVYYDYFTLADDQIWTHEDGYLVQNSIQALRKLAKLCQGVKVKCGNKVVGKIASARIDKCTDGITKLTIRIDFNRNYTHLCRDLGTRWFESEYHWMCYGENDLCVVEDISTIYSIEVFGNFSDKANSMKVKPKRVRIHK